MSLAVLIGTYILLATIIIGFGVIFLAVIAKKRNSGRKRYKR